MKTDFESLRNLAAFIIGHLTDHKIIEYAVPSRLELIDALAVELNVSFATDEDIKDQAIEEVAEKLGEGNVPEAVTESEIYNQAKKEIIKSFQGEVIAGLYMVESLHNVALRIRNFLMNSELIEDLFATDEEIVEFLITRIRQFEIRR